MVKHSKPNSFQVDRPEKPYRKFDPVTTWDAHSSITNKDYPGLGADHDDLLGFRNHRSY